MATKIKQTKTKTTAVAATIFVIYDGFDILDIAGPFAFLQAGGLNPVLAGVEKRTYKSGQGIEFNAQYSFRDKAIKEIVKGSFLIWVPGGFGDGLKNQFYKGNPLLTWLSSTGSKATMVSSVCTGALIAAAAGLLDNCEVTTHWAFKKSLELFKKKNNLKVSDGYPRYLHDKKHQVVTGGGISSGLDESIYLISILGGDEKAMRAQLTNQYAPFLQFNAGIPATAPDSVTSFVRKEITDDYCKKQLDPLIKKFLK